MVRPQGAGYVITGTNLSIAKKPKTTQLSFRGGDAFILSPSGHMLSSPWTKVLGRFFCKFSVLPFVSLKVGRFGAYAGFKGVGWDDTYRAWLDDYSAGDFLILTGRFFTDG